MDKLEIKKIIEAIIFAADAPMSLDKLCNIIEGEEREAVKEALLELVDGYSVGHGVVLAEVAGGFQFRTLPEHAAWLKRLHKIATQKISKAALESLAILAYKQPATRGELEEVRGVDSGGVVKTLLDKRLIKIVGRKDVPGRPVVYGTTKEFLETFDLKDLTHLPALRDIEEILEEDDELREAAESVGQSPGSVTEESGSDDNDGSGDSEREDDNDSGDES